MGDDHTSIALTPSTHRRLKRLKRGGETFDTLLQKMADQYDPAEARKPPLPGE